MLTVINFIHGDFEKPKFYMLTNWFYWGIGIAFHAIGVFGKGIIFSKDWEERKIQELIEEENEVKF